jgi:dolichol-phosphate mannosyltransferase
MSQTLKQLYFEMRNAALVMLVPRAVITALVLAADMLVSFAVFFSGHSMALSHISGFVAASLLFMVLRLFAPGPLDSKPGSTSEASTALPGVIKKILLVTVYTLVQLAIRGGCIASLSQLGLNDSLSLGLGIIVATIIGRYSSVLLLVRTRHDRGPADSGKRRQDVESASWLRVGIALTVCVFVLRLVFLNALEIIPQEAYYWNYAQHLSPGYLDHPPLVAATIYVGEMVFGHNAWGSRFGAFVYGIIFIIIFYRYARLQVEQTSAVFAVSLTLLLPYYFLGSGFLITPDAGLSMAWMMAIYFFYRALVNEEKTAWYGVGIAMGIGLLSKYSIVLLAPAALLFIVLDARLRRCLLTKEPYLAVLIAALIFSPVIYWNVINDWASFEFQAIERFEKAPQFSLGILLTNIFAMVTPLPLLALPYLFTGNILRRDKSSASLSLPTSLSASPFDARMRLFSASFLFVPLSVFAWSALSSEPRYNWTGPLWVTILPMLAWLIIHARQLRWRLFALLLGKFTLPILFILIMVYSLLLHSLTLGLPGVAFPFGTARLLGWQEVSRNILTIQKKLLANGEKVIVTGMDKYFISSKLAYYGTPEFLGENNKLEVSGTQIVGGDSLMFAYWNPVDQYKGDTVIMLSRDKFELRSRRLKPYFKKISSGMSSFPVYKNDFGLDGETIREYYYRIGYSYKPPQP